VLVGAAVDELRRLFVVAHTTRKFGTSSWRLDQMGLAPCRCEVLARFRFLATIEPIKTNALPWAQTTLGKDYSFPRSPHSPWQHGHDSVFSHGLVEERITGEVMSDPVPEVIHGHVCLRAAGQK